MQRTNYLSDILLLFNDLKELQQMLKSFNHLGE